MVKFLFDLKKTKLNALFILLILFASGCKEPPSDAPEIITKITGKISDAKTNVPMPGVLITTNPVTSSVITGQDGNYTISDVTPGQYTITAKKDGYNDNTTTVTVNEGKTVNADIQLIMLGPELEVSLTTLDFDVSKTNLTLNLTNKSKIGTITWQINANKSWIIISPSNGTLTTETDIISIAVSRDSVDYGNYAGLITVNSDYGTKEINVVMVMQNPTAPQITITPSLIDLGLTNNNQPVQIKNTGTGTLTWSATPNANWILLSATSGNALPGNPSDILISVNKSGLPQNNYEGLISFTSDGGNQNVVVKMQVAEGTINPPTAQVVGTPTQSSITVGWTKITDPKFSNYKIYRSIAPGVTENSTLVTIISNANENTFADEGLNSGTTYCYKVYVYSNNGIGSGSNEISATTTVGLKTWVLQTEFENAKFYNVFANSDDDCWAVGENSGKGFYARWNGSEWKGYYFEDLKVIREIYFLSPNEGYAVARSSDYKLVLMKYNGISWTKISSDINSSSGRIGMTVLSSNLIYVVDGYRNKIYSYNGIDWASSTVGNSGNYFYLIGTKSYDDIWAINNINEVYRHNGTGWGKDDNASTLASYRTFFQILFLGSNPYISTDYGIYKYNNSKWNEIKLSSGGSVQEAGSLCFINSSYGWVGNYYGKLYLFNGTSLEEKSSPTTSSLNDIFMLNINSGWAVGDKGVILRYK